MSEDQKLEKHHRIYGLIPRDKFTHKGFEVAIGEGGPFFEYSEEATKHDFPNGYYQAVYAIKQGGKALGEMPLFFEYFHDIAHSAEARRKMRIASAKKAAMALLDEYQKVMNEPV